MADEKKPDAKPAPASAPAERDEFVEIVSILVIVLIIMTLVGNLIANFRSNKIFENGLKGLTPRGVLLSHTRPISSLENPIDAKVVSINETEVYSSPDGKMIGTQPIGARGKILQGPVEINGERYWYVDYEEGEDGWVKESDIAYLEREPGFIARMIIKFLAIYWYLKLFIFVVCAVFIFCIVYLFREITKMRINEDKLLYPKGAQIMSATNPKWENILDQIESLNENDWKLAILEADIMLADILDRLPLPGETIGDKLKAVEESDFTTVDNAWEAHKIRNQIAHEGSSFMLNQREARRVIGLYRTVFEEFHVI